jgi:hypothetical protein
MDGQLIKVLMVKLFSFLTFFLNDCCWINKAKNCQIIPRNMLRVCNHEDFIILHNNKSCLIIEEILKR